MIDFTFMTEKRSGGNWFKRLVKAGAAVLQTEQFHTVDSISGKGKYSVGKAKGRCGHHGKSAFNS